MSIQFRTRNVTYQPSGFTGACCYAIGEGKVCNDSDGLNFKECSDLGGVFLGMGTTCANGDSTCDAIPINTPSVLGACCACDGTCVDSVTEDYCNIKKLDPTTPTHKFHMGETCQSVDCESQTLFDCCADGIVFAGICTNESCREISGATADFGSGCDGSNLIPASSGICCNVTSIGYDIPCQYMDNTDSRWGGNPEAFCVAIGGTFFDDEVCGSEVCQRDERINHACCRHNGCFSLPEDVCLNSYGMYLGQVGCENTNCQNIMFGACCHSNTCNMTDATTCNQLRGEFFSGYDCSSTMLQNCAKQEPTGKCCRTIGEPKCVDSVTELGCREIVQNDYLNSEWIFVEGGDCHECQDGYSCYDKDDEIGSCLYTYAPVGSEINQNNKLAFMTTRKWCEVISRDWNSTIQMKHIFKGCGITPEDIKTAYNSFPGDNPDGYAYDDVGSASYGYPVGSCSINGVCNNFYTRDDCVNSNGIYMGNGTHCYNSVLTDMTGDSSGEGSSVLDPTYSNYTSFIKRGMPGRFIDFISSSYEDDVNSLPTFYYRIKEDIMPPMRFPADSMKIRRPNHNKAVKAIEGKELLVHNNAPLGKIRTLSLIEGDSRGRYRLLDIHGINMNLLDGIKKLDVMPDSGFNLENISSSVEVLNVQGKKNLFNVRVIGKSDGTGSQYEINGIPKDKIFLYVGQTYTFDLSDISLRPSDDYSTHHTLRFSETPNGLHDGGVPYNTNVSVGEVGREGSHATITITESTPNRLYYYCSNHINMGGEIEIRKHYQNDSLNLSSKINLRKLFINDTALDTLNLPSSDSLEVLNCSGNNLSSINILSHPYLYSLDISYNKIGAIDLSGFGQFNGDGSLDVSNNKITSLNVPTLHQGTGLRQLDASDNPLVILDIKDDSKIDILDISYTNLSYISMPKNTGVKELHMNNCKINSISLQGSVTEVFGECVHIDASNNKLSYIPFIDADKNIIPANLTQLNLAGNNIGTADVVILFNVLKEYAINNNTSKLTIDLSGNPATINQASLTDLKYEWGNNLSIINNTLT